MLYYHYLAAWLSKKKEKKLLQGLLPKLDHIPKKNYKIFKLFYTIIIKNDPREGINWSYNNVKVQNTFLTSTHDLGDNYD